MVVALQFAGVRDFSQGYAIIIENRKYGLIDNTGKVVVKPQYDSLSDCFLLK
jgi:hypothetical protein